MPVLMKRCAACSLPETAAYPRVADQLQRIMIRGTMQQLRHEMSKPAGSIPHIMNWVYYGPEGTLFNAINSGRINNRSMNSCILAHRWGSTSIGPLLALPEVSPAGQGVREHLQPGQQPYALAHKLQLS